jgi:hypothetical protein
MDGSSTTASSDDAAIIREIESEFPGWGLWHSGTGRWWAFRTAANPLTISQLRAGCQLIVQANTPDTLRGEIRTENSAAQRALDDNGEPVV